MICTLTTCIIGVSTLIEGKNPSHLSFFFFLGEKILSSPAIWNQDANITAEIALVPFVDDPNVPCGKSPDINSDLEV